MFSILNRVLSAFLITVYLLISQTQTAVADSDKLPANILMESMTPLQEQYISRLLQWIRNNAGDDLVLDEKDIALKHQIENAKQRALRLSYIFSFDLDGNGIVTQTEVALWHSLHSRNRHSKYNTNVLVTESDLNKDGNVTFAEALKAAHAANQEKASFGSSRGQTEKLKELLALDPNGNNRLTLNELKTLGRETFAIFDKDGNGTLSSEETKKLSKARRASRNARRQKNRFRNFVKKCELPQAGQSDEILVVSSYEAGRLSNVSVAGSDEETETSNIVIEPGETPLYVIVNAFTPIIWNFTGHVERVKTIVALGRSRQGNSPAVGIIGIPKDKINFSRSKACFSYVSNPQSGKARLVKARLKGLFGRAVDKMIIHYSLSGVDLPSGKIHAHPRGADKKVGFLLDDKENSSHKVDRATIRELLRFSPDGVARLDPKKVVTPGKAIAYKVLPQQAGLIQLMKEGKLERLPDRMYLIKEPIPHFPAGLAGAHSVKFLLGKGVPMPKGHPGHSSVISEESGKRLK